MTYWGTRLKGEMDSKAMRSVHAAVQSSVDRLLFSHTVFLGPITHFSLLLYNVNTAEIRQAYGFLTLSVPRS